MDASLCVTYRTILGRLEDVRKFFGGVLNFAKWVKPCTNLLSLLDLISNFRVMPASSHPILTKVFKLLKLILTAAAMSFLKEVSLLKKSKNKDEIHHA